MERKYKDSLAIRINSELYQIRKQTQMILNSKLSVCAFRDEHRGFGKVKYDRLLSHKPAWILGKEYPVCIVSKMDKYQSNINLY